MSSANKSCLLYFSNSCSRFRLFFIRCTVVGLVSAALLAVVGTCSAQESREIDLGAIGRVDGQGGLTNINPMIEFYLPPDKSKDRFNLSPRGLGIEQFADVKDRPPWKAGFRTMVMMKRDFRVQLDFDCKIKEPSKGWGQGLLLAVAMDDEKATEYKLGRLAIPGSGQICQMELSGRHIEQPIYMPTPCELTSGSLIIERAASRVFFSVVHEGQTLELGELESPVANVRYVEVTCTRQQEGNTEASYLLKKLHLHTDDFFSFERPSTFRFSWWVMFMAINGLVVAGLVYFYNKQNSL